VLEPYDADRDEARALRQVSRPLVDDRSKQVLVAVGGKAKLEDKDCGCDRQHCIAEPVESADGELIGNLGCRHCGQYRPAV